MQDTRHAYRGLLWDDTNGIMIAATPPSTFFETLGINTYMSGGEPRTFMARGLDGQLAPKSVEITAKAGSVTVGESVPNANGRWTEERIYTDEITRMKSERRFLQYGARKAVSGIEHENGLADLRALINAHGEGGAWLWDPYLSADDILNTLFYCTHAGADLRALTEGKGAPAGTGAFSTGTVWTWLKALFSNPAPAPSGRERFDREKSKLEAAKGNLRGLRLEYRAKIGAAGWRFHDRFLIFPRPGRGALAWSLGTSVNSFGREHHILQQVVDGQMVLNAFEDLWDELNDPDYVIWKAP